LVTNGKPEIGRLSLLSVVIIAMSFVQVIQPWPIKYAIDYVLHGKPLDGAAAWLMSCPGAATTKGQLAWLAGISVLIFVVAQSLGALKNWLSSLIGHSLTMRLAAQLYAHLIRQNKGFHQKHARGDIVKRVMQDSRCARVFVLDAGVALTTAVVTVFAIGIAAWSIDPAMTVVALGFGIPVFFLNRWFGPRMTEYAYEQAEQEGTLYTQTERTLSSMPIVQAFSMQNYEHEQFKQVADRTLLAYLRMIKSQLQFNFGVSAITAVGTAVIMAWGGYRVLQGQLTVGDLWVFLSYLTVIFGPITTLAYLATTIAEGKARARRVFDMIDNDSSVREPDERDTLMLPDTSALSVGFNDVRVGYAEGHPVLKSVSLRIKAGEMLAIVGESGAGKSTLVSLIGRMLDPWEGQVTIGGVNAAQVRLSALRSRIAWLPQCPTLMPLSIADNIAFGRPTATQGEIESAARKAGAHDFIQSMPDGYRSMIGENGSTLSGGQAQRIALARALLLNSGIIILDEPTSSVDANTERSIIESLSALRGHKTIIVIAHRLSTVRKSDRIAVLHDGEIVESGCHDEIVRLQGHYCELMHTQLTHTAGNQ
jgi:ATP-binding cassette subfamily B protein/subfamily B ATP-binding cassette protein MsbA